MPSSYNKYLKIIRLILRTLFFALVGSYLEYAASVGESYFKKKTFKSLRDTAKVYNSVLRTSGKIKLKEFERKTLTSYSYV